MASEDKKQWATELLRERAKLLGRNPKKDDFDEVTRSRIKAFLGPWPRALEIAGLKESVPKEKKRKKRSAKHMGQRKVAIQKYAKNKEKQE